MTITQLFDEMIKIYGDKWKLILKSAERRRLFELIWSSGLANLTPEQMNRGLSMCSCYTDHPPTVVIFYHWSMGLPIDFNFRKSPLKHVEMERDRRYIQKLRENIFKRKR